MKLLKPMFHNDKMYKSAPMQNTNLSRGLRRRNKAQ